jgi:uncharacterized protein involved in oxidation of intracellular sulfur
LAGGGAARGGQLKNLFVLNDPPYGTERSYNALRLACALAKREGEDVRIFLMGDAAACAKAGHSVPQGYYNVNRMLQAVILNQAAIGVCGSCMDARGITEAELLEGTRRNSMEQLADWTQWADRVLVF